MHGVKLNNPIELGNQVKFVFLMESVSCSRILAIFENSIKEFMFKCLSPIEKNILVNKVAFPKFRYSQCVAMPISIDRFNAEQLMGPLALTAY